MSDFWLGSRGFPGRFGVATMVEKALPLEASGAVACRTMQRLKVKRLASESVLRY
jgi:hypothetical protein